MPTYVYKREDNTRFEIEQRITAPALEVCPTTGQKVRRVPSAGAGLVFKGSGFYQTDYVRKSDSGKQEGEGAAPKEAKEGKPDAGSSTSGTSSAGEASAPSTASSASTAGASTPGTAGST